MNRETHALNVVTVAAVLEFVVLGSAYIAAVTFLLFVLVAAPAMA